jgi:hypothetical protein
MRLQWSVEIAMQHGNASARGRPSWPSLYCYRARARLLLFRALSREALIIKNRAIDQSRSQYNGCGMRSFHDCNAILWVVGISGDTHDGRSKPCP